MTALRRWLPICALWCVFAASASPAPTEALSADVAPQPLAQALTAFANQTGLQLVYVSEMVGTRQTKGASAGVSLTAALTQLLDGTGLQFEFINARTVRIHTPPAAVPARREQVGASWHQRHAVGLARS